jgi:amino acid transporter
MTVAQATFIGVGSMVGAGIFALLGAAGAVAGSAVWLSFLIAGAIAGLQGYSFAKLGATFPSGGGLLAFIARGFGEGHFAGIVAWLFYVTGSIVAAMVASSFGGYASSVFTGNDATWAKVWAVLLVLVMTALNAVGSNAVARVQSVIVKIVLAILTVFALATIANWNPALLDPAGYPGVREIIASVALTFFAFLGFGVITFTAKDLPNPKRQLPRAVYIALAIATTVYVAVALGVFGTLTADEVVAYGTTALAQAARPVLGDWGYVLMVITALFSTAGAVNASLYPSVGMTQHLASVGSAVALLVFSAVTISHFRLYKQTGANLFVLIVALVATLGTFVVFVTTTLVNEPATAVALVAIVVLALVVDFVWKRVRGPRRTEAVPDAPEAPAAPEA